jgi:D-psicose/D-tagatose/L-ribulose 3-epimerase
MAIMKVGIDLLLWTDCPTAREHGSLLEKIKSWGYDGVELMVGAMQPDDIRQLSGLADDLELGRTAIMVLGADNADPAAADPALRQAAVEEIKRVADLTRDFGATVLAGPLFQGLGRFSGAGPTENEWQWAVDTIRQAGEYAANAGVRLALEPLNRFEMYMVNTMADGVRFVKDVGLDNVGLLADTHHGNIEENNTAVAWKAAAEHIFHVHISENHRGTPGSGHAIPPEIFTTLSDAGYDGWLTIEAFGTSVPSLIPMLNLWRSYADSEEEIARLGLQYIQKNLHNITA